MIALALWANQRDLLGNAWVAYSIADILKTAKKYGIEQPEQLPYDQLLSLIAKKGNGDAWETIASVISGANYLEPWELPRG